MNAELDLLQGVRVADFSQYESGPACTAALAWLGADVVKIENPDGGDPGRSSGSAAGTDGHWFQQWNANKRSITLNLKVPADLETAKAMIARADVFVENFRPGGIEEMGLGYDVVKKINPSIVYAQLKGFGKGSPFESNLSFDVIGQAVGGSLSVTGHPDRAPVKPGATVGDAGTGMLLATSIVAALYKRAKTGEGAHIEIAMQDAVMHYLRGAFARTAKTGKAAVRNGAKSPGVVNVPSNLYPCRPGGSNDYVYIYPSRNSVKHWQRLLDVIGRADLKDDPRFDGAQGRIDNEGFIDEIISAWTRQKTKHEAMQLLGDAGIPAGAVLDTLELQNDESLAQRGLMQRVVHEHLGDFKMLTWPARIDGKVAALRPAPSLGDVSGEILKEWLERPGGV